MQILEERERTVGEHNSIMKKILEKSVGDDEE
jgi:hypothetical protein